MPDFSHDWWRSPHERLHLPTPGDDTHPVAEETDRPQGAGDLIAWVRNLRMELAVGALDHMGNVHHHEYDAGIRLQSKLATG